MPSSQDKLPQGGYDPRFFGVIDAVEARHFWYRARRRAIARLARQLTVRLPNGYHVLELGCGNGSLLGTLQRACRGGKVVGMDLYHEGLLCARAHGNCSLVQGDVRHPPFAQAFALVGLFDVLEHLEDDCAILRSVAGMLAPAGALLLTVPAHPWLWSYFDVASRHCRRYTAPDLTDKLDASGLEVEYLTPYMAGTFPLVWLARQIQGWRGRAAGSSSATEMAARDLRIVPGINRALDWLLSFEAPLIARRQVLPAGSSFLAVARKRGARC